VPDGAAEQLAALVDKNLVRTVELGVQPRYALHVIREFAREQLARAGEAEAVQTVYAEHFVALAEQAERERHGPRQIACLEGLSWSTTTAGRCLRRRRPAAMRRLACGWPRGMAVSEPS
jgi:predicted ATPase